MDRGGPNSRPDRSLEHRRVGCGLGSGSHVGRRKGVEVNAIMRAVPHAWDVLPVTVVV